MRDGEGFVPKKVDSCGVRFMTATRSKGKGQLVGEMSAKREWGEGQKIDRQRAHRYGLRVNGGKHVRLVKQIEGKVDGV